MNRSETIRHGADCGVCGISLHGIHAAPSISGRLLCETCHVKFGAVHHTISRRMLMMDMRSRRVNPWARRAVYLAAIVVAAVAAWLLT